MQITQALVYMHTRDPPLDLKPENVLVNNYNGGFELQV